MQLSLFSGLCITYPDISQWSPIAQCSNVDVWFLTSHIHD